jgi:hypothetical protein
VFSANAAAAVKSSMRNAITVQIAFFIWFSPSRILSGQTTSP